MRALLITVLVVGLVGLPGNNAPGRAQSAEPPVLDREFSWPHDGPLLELFDPGESPYGPGHRGVDIAVLPDDPVRAVADGIVTFAGPVAGTTWVTIEHQSGLLSTIGALATLSVAAGAHVARGQVIGSTTGAVHDDVPGIHVSFRWQQQYIDPLEVLPPRNQGPSLVGSGGWRAGDPPDKSAATMAAAGPTTSSPAASGRPARWPVDSPPPLQAISGIGHLPAGPVLGVPSAGGSTAP